MVPVGVWVVLDKIKVGSIGQGTYVCISVRSIRGKVRTSLAIVNLRPMGGDSCDMVFLEYFLDAVYSIPTIDYGPGTTRDLKQFFDI
jgi:hypothetical protein